MEEHVTPGAFYGSALAALCGLAMGLMLHGSWTNHTHGPQLQLSSAADGAPMPVALAKAGNS